MKDEIRPYVHNREIEPGSRLEERILDILDEIGKDIRVSQTLEIFRSLEEIFNYSCGIAVHTRQPRPSHKQHTCGYYESEKSAGLARIKPTDLTTNIFFTSQNEPFGIGQART